jgi:methionyl-tRNA formyltransferase
MYKIAYFGSPDFAADFLEKLITDTSINQLIEVKLVVTQPDKKVGRKQILTPTPVRIIAEKYKLSEDTFFETIARGPHGGVAVEKNGIKLTNIDLGLVYAYGDLIPKELLSLPKYGFWNIHPSLLPKYRGPSPIATPLINGDKITGVTIIKMDEEIDHGPIIAQESYTIKEADYRTDLETKLTNLAFEMFKKTVTQLTGLRVNELKTKEQNHKEAIYTNKLSKQDGFIEFEKIKLILQKPTLNSSLLTFNLFRGLYPWPGLWTVLPNGKRLKITELFCVVNKDLCSLQIKRVQLEGKKEVDFPTFNKSYNIF